MNIKNFLKATETIIVLGGLLLSLLFGKFWIFVTAIAYVLVNIPNAWKSILNWLDKKTDVDFEASKKHVGTRPNNPPNDDDNDEDDNNNTITGG